MGKAGINPLVLSRRILTLYRKGVAGVVLYETEYGVLLEALKELLPLLHDTRALEKWASDESVQAR